MLASTIRLMWSKSVPFGIRHTSLIIDLVISIPSATFLIATYDKPQAKTGNDISIYIEICWTTVLLSWYADLVTDSFREVSASLSSTDVDEEIKLLLHLQDTYGLNTAKLANGTIQDIKTSQILDGRYEKHPTRNMVSHLVAIVVTVGIFSVLVKTHWSRGKWLPSCRRHFRIHVLKWKIEIKILLTFVPNGSMNNDSSLL